MDISKVESVKELIRVLPNTLMQMPSMGISRRRFVSTDGKIFSNNTQTEIENQCKV